MLSGLIREYVSGMSCDPRFYALLRGSGLSDMGRDSDVVELAEGWLDDVELVTGRQVSPGTRAQVVRFVDGRLPGLVARFRGNVDAAHLTMVNLLDTRFADLRV